jgi:hypothetical protein
VPQDGSYRGIRVAGGIEKSKILQVRRMAIMRV